MELSFLPVSRSTTLSGYSTLFPVDLFSSIMRRMLTSKVVIHYMQPKLIIHDEGIKALEFGVPLDGANINKAINVCACEELSDEVWKMYDQDNTTESCVMKTDDETTLDLSHCNTAEWSCFDGVQDITNVRPNHNNIFN